MPGKGQDDNHICGPDAGCDASCMELAAIGAMERDAARLRAGVAEIRRLLAAVESVDDPENEDSLLSLHGQSVGLKMALKALGVEADDAG